MILYDYITFFKRYDHVNQQGRSEAGNSLAFQLINFALQNGDQMFLNAEVALLVFRLILVVP